MNLLQAELTGRGLPRLSLTPDEAAESTGFSRTRIFAAIRDGALSARKDGKATVIETTELLRWFDHCPYWGGSRRMVLNFRSN